MLIIIGLHFTEPVLVFVSFIKTIPLTKAVCLIMVLDAEDRTYSGKWYYDQYEVAGCRKELAREVVCKM
jgi:hypothetical protein